MAAVIIGGITVLLLGLAPYISFWIDPSPSISQQVGEAARDFFKGLSGLGKEEELSTADRVSLIMTILGFICLVLAVILSIMSFQKFGKNAYAIGGLSLAGTGLLLYLFQFAVALILLVILLAFIASFLGFG